MTAPRAAAAAASRPYGAWLAASALLALAALGASAPAAAHADTVGALPVAAPGGRTVDQAPVVPPAAAPPFAPVPGPDAASSGTAVPPATQGRDLPARGFAPTGLVLPGGTRAPVVPVGLHADGALAIPDDVRSVGWWTGGSQAGEAFGSVVVAGHVDSAERGIGVLAELKHLVPGQVVELDAAGRAQRYRITSATLVPRARIARDTGLFGIDGAPRLVLVTCGGAFDRERHRYQDNLVVLATPA